MQSAQQGVQNSKGFTLIELIVVMVILAILAIIAIPKYINLTEQTKASATKVTLGAVRSALAIKYAESAATGAAAFPPSLGAADFADGKEPVNQCTSQDGVGAVDVAPAGTATSATDGFWYVPSTGNAGAYAASSGSACKDTSNF